MDWNSLYDNKTLQITKVVNASKHNGNKIDNFPI